jgi:hypothetical protein
MPHFVKGKRAMYRTRPAWHNIGDVFAEDADIRATEAAKRLSGDYRVLSCPVRFEIDGVEYVSDKHVMIALAPTHDQKTPVEFGTASKDWMPESYVELAKGLDKLSEKYKIETAGVLKDGAMMFMSFRAEDWDVCGDEMRSYFTANLWMQPGKGHTFNHSGVRVECWNLNTMAESLATISLSIPHNSDAKQQIGIMANMVVRFKEAQSKTKELCEQFARTTISMEQAQSIFEAAYPDPKLPKKVEMIRKAMGSDEAAQNLRMALDADALSQLVTAEEAFERAMEKKIELRDGCVALYKGFHPTEMQGTIWAAYNAVTENADWRDDHKSTPASTMFGSRAKEKSRAFAQSLQVLEEVSA